MRGNILIYGEGLDFRKTLIYWSSFGPCNMTPDKLWILIIFITWNFVVIKFWFIEISVEGFEILKPLSLHVKNIMHAKKNYNSYIISDVLEKEKKRLNAALPAGVTEKDVQFFTLAQDKAKVRVAIWIIKGFRKVVCLLECQ